MARSRSDLVVLPAGSELPADFAPRLRMATMRLARLLRQHADPDHSQTLISALATVARCGPVTLGRLAELEAVQPPSMTRIVAKLEDLGLVARVTDGADRRIARVSVTPAAEQLLAEVRTRRNEVLAARLADLAPEDVVALEAALPALERLAGLPS
jgi:DNA-binding MarR family transcriptional regulator